MVTWLKKQTFIRIFKKRNIEIGIINVHSIKPFDHHGLEKAIKKSEKLIILEDHNFYGGVGSIVSSKIKIHP